MKVFVIHYPPLAERKRNLLAQFREFGIDSEWVENFNQDDPFVIWLKKITNTPLPVSHLSAFVKRLFVYKKMIDDDIKEAIIFEDDVILHPEFKEFKVGPNCFNYLRLGVGIHEGKIPYSSSKLHRLSNPGGGEAAWVTQDFARGFLDDLNFDYTHDIVEFGHLRITMHLLPVCHQTSLSDPGATACKSYDSTKWAPYVEAYQYLPKWKFKNLLKLYLDKLM